MPRIFLLVFVRLMPALILVLAGCQQIDEQTRVQPEDAVNRTTAYAEVLDRNETVSMFVAAGPARPFMVWGDDLRMAAAMLVLSAAGLVVLHIRRRRRISPD